MAEMIERVARALAAHSWEMGGNDHSIEQFVDRRWMHYTAPARAAIRAMQEATDTMKDAGCEVGPDTNSGQFGYDDAASVYSAMIGAALTQA